MHVLSCDAWGGTEVQVAELVIAANAAGAGRHEVAILDRPGPLSAHLRSAGVAVHGLWGRFGYAGAVARLARLLRSREPAVVEAYGTRVSALVRLARVPRRRPPLVVAVRGAHFVEAHEESRRARVAIAVERMLAGGVAAYAANSEGAAATLARAGLPRERIAVIPSAVAVGPPPPARPERAEPVIVSVARFSPIKRHDVLLRALARLADAGTPFGCRLVGEGPTLDVTRRLAADLGIAGRVEFMGPLPHPRVREVLDGADVFTLVSDSEGMPGSVLEAMAAGLPVVATDVVGIRAIVEDGRTGLLVPSADPPALAEALASLLDAPQRRAELGRAGRAAVEREHSLEALVGARAAFYERLARPAG